MKVFQCCMDWFVEDDNDKIHGPFSNQSSAWRWVDRQEGEPVSANESRHQFGWDKFVNGE